MQARSSMVEHQVLNLYVGSSNLPGLAKGDNVSSFEKSIQSEDGNTIKYITHDGAEHVLKFNHSCSGESTYKKATLFISSTVGCRQGCKFCHLTENNTAFKKLTEQQLIEHIKEIIFCNLDRIRPEYFKMSFMGMGDCFDTNLDYIFIVTSVLKFCLEHRVKYIDGVDFCTSWPKNVDYKRMFLQIQELDQDLDAMKQLLLFYTPANKKHLVRLFVSLHSMDDNTRLSLMPNSEEIQSIIEKVNLLDVPVIFHHMFLERVNDSLCEVNSLFDVENEIRILRFNKHPDSELTESIIYDAMVLHLQRAGLNIKEQDSRGKEINSACGMFTGGDNEKEKEPRVI